MAKQKLDLAGEDDVQKTTSTLKTEIGDSKSDAADALKVSSKAETQQDQDAAEIARSFESDGPAKGLNHDINMEHDGNRVYRNLINFKEDLPAKLAQLPNFLQRAKSIIRRMSAEQIDLDYTDEDISSGRVTIGQGMINGVDKGVVGLPYWKHGGRTNHSTRYRTQAFISDLMEEFSDEIGGEQDKWRHIFNQLFTLKTGIGLWGYLSSNGWFLHVGRGGGYGVAASRGDFGRPHYLFPDNSDAWQYRVYRRDESGPSFKNK